MLFTLETARLSFGLTVSMDDNCTTIIVYAWTVRIHRFSDPSCCQTTDMRNKTYTTECELSRYAATSNAMLRTYFISKTHGCIHKGSGRNLFGRLQARSASRLPIPILHSRDIFHMVIYNCVRTCVYYILRVCRPCKRICRGSSEWTYRRNRPIYFVFSHADPPSVGSFIYFATTSTVLKRISKMQNKPN